MDIFVSAMLLLEYERAFAARRAASTRRKLHAFGAKKGETSSVRVDKSWRGVQNAPLMNDTKRPYTSALGSLIFLSRWLQAPLYLGLIIAQAVYVYRFLLELWHLIGFSLGIGSRPVSVPVEVTDAETVVMLSVLGLIDVVMIANLLIMVIVGGYETFVSRLNLEGHPDQPEWLSHVNAGILKVKLATALIGISSIHLLKTFINADKLSDRMMLWQVVIHVAFLLSALALASIDRLTFSPASKKTSAA